MLQRVYITGLTTPPTKEELEQCRIEFVTHCPIKLDFATLFAQFGVTDIFCLHLLHRHEKLVEGRVIVGQDLSYLPGRWVRPLAIDTVVGSKIHGHLFRFKDNSFRPYEYDVGPPPMHTIIVKDEFFSAFAEILRLHGLENVLALELIDKSYGAEMMEIEIRHQGTVMLPISMLKGCKPYRQTGWKFEAYNGEVRVCKDGTQTHGTGPLGNHITAQGSLGRDLESFDDVLIVLRSADILSDTAIIL